METGTIKKLLRERGFGFIRTNEGQEVFFHRSECRHLDFETLDEGQEIRCELDQVPKGPRARNLRPRDGN